MSEYFLPLTIAVGGWWLSTAIILYLNHLPARTYRWSMLGSTVLLIAALWGLGVSATDTTRFGAVFAFLEGLLIWAWLEMSYFMGIITGSNKAPCPSGCRGWPRFVYALKTSLHHELSIIAVGVMVFAITWEQPNPFGAMTFATLWFMRWSAKLNLFLGVPNVNAEWFPEHLRYLTSYLGKRSMNLLFPISVSAATVLATVLCMNASAAADPFETTGYTLVAVLLILAILEHWFLVLPLRDSALWNFALRAATKRVVQTSE